MEIAPEVVRNYGRAVQHGHRHIHQALPRMLTVWFDFGSACFAQRTPANNKVLRACGVHAAGMWGNHNVLWPLLTQGYAVQPVTLLPAFFWAALVSQGEAGSRQLSIPTCLVSAVRVGKACSAMRRCYVHQKNMDEGSDGCGMVPAR